MAELRGAELSVYPDRESLSRGAANLFAGEASRAVASRGRFDVLLSGGETPRRLYELLGEPPFAGSIPWEAVQFFWGDERHLPHDHPQSNFGMARGAFLDKLPLDASQLHPIPYLDTPRASAGAYEELLRRHFAGRPPRFDLALLGLGDNGHTASLFPGSSALAETERWVCGVEVADSVPQRVTVTVPVLNAAALAVFLVAGSGKAAVLREVLEGPDQPQLLPAQLVRPFDGRLLWLVDREAAALLVDAGDTVKMQAR